MFYNQLKNIRKTSGKTQKELADFLQISTQSISKWEKGESLPSLEFLPRIAKFFGCSINAFFTDIEMNANSGFNRIDSTKEALELEGKINNAFRHFHLNAEVIKIHEGVRIFSFVVAMLDGCGLSDVKKRANDILYQINEDKAVFNTKDYMDNTFGIEIPRKNFNEIPLSLALKSNEFLNSHHKIPLIIGYDVNDDLIIDDLTRLPHLLVGGAIWSGKSSFLRNLITCMTSLLSPRQLQLIICDPKKIEFDYAKGYPHLLGKVINTFDDAIEQMRKLVDTMNKRTAMLASAGVRNLDDYNQKTKPPLPRLVLIVDELADLVIYSAEIEELIMQLTMKGRRVGIHLILSSQISAPHIFTPIIKANIPSRASFQVSKPSESKVLLEESGAELLSNHGDMIYSSVTIPTTRLQAPYISKEASVELAQKN